MSTAMYVNDTITDFLLLKAGLTRRGWLHHRVSTLGVVEPRQSGPLPVSWTVSRAGPTVFSNSAWPG
jgi:hypothetical protein